MREIYATESSIYKYWIAYEEELGVFRIYFQSKFYSKSEVTGQEITHSDFLSCRNCLLSYKADDDDQKNDSIRNSMKKGYVR